METQINDIVNSLRRAALRQEEGGLTDGQLLARFIEQRDQAAVTALVQRHGPMVWGICRRILRNHHDAEDAFQATFLVLVRKAVSIRQREMMANWMYGVAHQTAMKARAMIAKRRTREKQGTAIPEPQAPEPDTRNGLQPLLDQELSRLPDRYRVAIVLCDLEGKTRREAARQLGLPEGTMAGRLTRGRAMLARRLSRRGLAVSSGALAAVFSQEAASACVPASLVGSTVKTATLVAAGQAVTLAIAPAKVVLLSEGVMKTMLLTKLKSALAAVLVAAAVVTGTAFTGTCLVPSGAHTASAAPPRAHTASATVPLPDDRPKPGPIDSDTIAAYKKLGAVYVGLHVLPTGWIEFNQGKEASAKDLPAFYFVSLPEGGLPERLPAVGVPFGLIFIGTKLTDAELKGLKDLKNLTALYLQDTKVSDVGLRELKDLKNLTTLGLGINAQVTDAGLKDVKGLKNLTTLDLQRTKVTDAGLKDVKELKNLTTLNLAGIKVSDAGLKDVKELKNLTTLDLNNTRVTDAGLKDVKELKNLTTLVLSNTSVTDAGLKDVKELKNLTTLDLQRTTVTDAGLKELKELKNLTSLNLHGTRVNTSWVLLGTPWPRPSPLAELKEALPKCQIVP